MRSAAVQGTRQAAQATAHVSKAYNTIMGGRVQAAIGIYAIANLVNAFCNCVLCVYLLRRCYMKKRNDCTLLHRTRQLLQQKDAVSYLDIYMDTGLPPNWLSLFATGKIKDPSVNKVQKLYEYLSNSRLTLE